MHCQIELSPHTNKVFLPDFSVLLRTNDELFPSDLSLKVSAEVTKPTYGCQVTIQSEQEKQMLKMYRREEKKERKRFKGGDEGDSTDALLTYDPREMRAQRYVVSTNLILVSVCLCCVPTWALRCV